MTPSDKSNIREGHTKLCYADFELASAATVLAGTKWEAEADALMKQCIELRERMLAEEAIG